MNTQASMPDYGETESVPTNEKLEFLKKKRRNMSLEAKEAEEVALTSFDKLVSKISEKYGWNEIYSDPVGRKNKRAALRKVYKICDMLSDIMIINSTNANSAFYLQSMLEMAPDFNQKYRLSVEFGPTPGILGNKIVNTVKRLQKESGEYKSVS